MSVSRNVRLPFGSFRWGSSCELMKPIGMIPCFLAALSSRLRARSRAASSSKCTWLKRASAFRTCAASWMGRRRFPCESMYAKALSGSCARSFAPSFAMGGMIARRSVTITAMAAEEGVSGGLDGLIEREADAVAESLSRAHPGALAENPDGVALLGDAVRDAIRLGLDTGRKHAARPVGELDLSQTEAWALWQRQRDRTPEARAWPAELSLTEPRVVARARELLVDAGREL